TADNVAFFLGAVGRFFEILDVNLTSLEGSFVQAVFWWLLSEQGAVRLRPHTVDIDVEGAAQGRIHVGQLHMDPTIFGLPSVGPVLDIHPSTPFFASFGSDSQLGHTVSLFMCAFSTVYTAYTFLTAVQADFGGEYLHMMEITTHQRALDSLRAVHPGFASLQAQSLESCFPEDFS
ncbi:hypothetical protein KIPB_016916, partial [Kipferlia bialata]